MSQQIIVIGGGTSFNTYKEYLAYLKNKKVDLEKFRKSGDWKSKLRNDIGKKYDVLYSPMPNKRYAKYKEWKIWFEKVLKLLDNNIILIGHSLGGMFLAKYLSENKVNKEITATILIASPFKDAHKNESLGMFNLPKSLELLTKQSKTIYLLYSKDDPVVPFEHMKLYQKELPNAKTKVFSKKGHFNQDHFPELVQLIKTLN